MSALACNLSYVTILVAFGHGPWLVAQRVVTFTEFPPWWTIPLVALAQLICLIEVVARRKEPAATLAWILALLTLPVISIVLYVLFGRDRVHRKAQRRIQRTLATQTRVANVLGTDAISQKNNALAEVRDGLIDARDRPLFLVGTALVRAPVTAGNRVTYLSDCEKVIQEKLAAIANARTSVHAEFYLVRHDKTGYELQRALISAAKRGCKVRLLVDGFGGLALSASYVRTLREAGVEFARFLPIGALGEGRQSRLRGAFQWNLRNHRKILVIDGVLGYIGGVNWGDDVRTWRDADLRIEGPGVHALQVIFLEDWEFATGQSVEQIESLLPPPQAFVSDSKHGLLEIVTSGPDSGTEAIHRLFFRAISSARERVWITTPYFVPDRAIMIALTTAALAGVDVRLLVPAKSNHAVTAAAGRSYYEELLAAGVRLYTYRPTLIHAKTIVVDGRMALVGSANMDIRSFRLNYEVHAVIRDEDVVRVLEQTFLEDLTQADLLRLEDWKQRGLAPRIFEGVGRLLSPLL